MAGQKLRTLCVMELLLEKTDEQHMLTAGDIIDLLKRKYNISADRRTIYGELQTLSDFGMDIIQQKGRNPGYYIGSRQFELAELKLLVDAVQSSRFITEKKSRELIKKLETLCSTSQADMLARQVSIINRPKTENETIYYNVDQIHSAIYYNKQISFKYAYWTMKKELELRKDGAVYVVSPWALTWGDENYYLVGYDAAAGKIKHYRVDKMRQTAITEQERQGEASFRDFDLAAFAKKTFGMYGGPDREVTLYCHRSVAGVVIDRFGHGVAMVPVDAEHFRARMMVAVSPQFFGWVTGVGESMRIEGPRGVVEEYQDYLRRILTAYGNPD